VDINDLRALSVVLMFVTFLGIIGWALMGRPDRFDAAANAPFADDDETPANSAGETEGKEKRS